MQKLSKDKEALKGEVARLERELQQERGERKAAVADAAAAAQAQVGCKIFCCAVAVDDCREAAGRRRRCIGGTCNCTGS